MASEGRLKYRGYQPDGLMGRLFTWGYNNEGQLGIGTNGTSSHKSSPVQVGSFADWRAAYLNSQSMFGRRGKTLWGWGNNGSGPLGLGDTNHRSSPVQVGSRKDWDFICASLSASSGNSFGLRTGGLFASGYNSSGQLGLGDRTNRLSFVQVGSALDWTFASTGVDHSLFIRAGKLFACGANYDGQMGFDNISLYYSSPVQVGSETDWTVVAAGDRTSYGIRGGMLFSWGNGFYGALGQGNEAKYSSPVQVGSRADWMQISCGSFFALGMRATNPLTNICGTIYSWGYNSNGQLGLTGTTHRSSPVQIGSRSDWTCIRAGQASSYGLRIPGKLFSWGGQGFGELGLGATLTTQSPVQVGSATDWVDIGVGAVTVAGIRP